MTLYFVQSGDDRWVRPGGDGLTEELSQAGLFDEEEAKRMAKSVTGRAVTVREVVGDIPAQVADLERRAQALRDLHADIGGLA